MIELRLRLLQTIGRHCRLRDIFLQLQFAQRQLGNVRRRGVWKLLEELFQRLRGCRKFLLRGSQFRDFQNRLSLPDRRHVRRQILLVHRHRLPGLSHPLQDAALLNHARGAHPGVAGQIRQPDQIRRRGQRRVRIAARELHAAKQLNLLPVQFRCEFLQCQRTQNGRGFVHFVLFEQRLGQQQLTAHHPFVGGVRFRTRLKRPGRLLQQGAHQRPLTELRAGRRFIHHRVQPLAGPRKIPRQPEERRGGSGIILVLKLRLAEPVNVLVGQLARLRFMRGKQFNGL